MPSSNPYAISEEEDNYLNKGDLEKFWYSRLQKKAPIARIGYALWCKKLDNLKKAVETGGPVYWNHRNYLYWEMMARSTVVNLSVGLQAGGFRGSFMQMRKRIREVGGSYSEDAC